ncbi:OLC1v1016249C1 [Oldenlandia corymbosa var. corymbosa]|uniref:OLC1v1016249C1 n=1 Tax=Oldenlandia corymbosa var. corymbosa TaxID=529605 RepID=A0AAV1E5A4_OLDCO|nr:OLC1v1016249C1 [Oldenlandia corymbosa var. corymbosa]
MAKLKTDSPLARRIANSILHFLNSVEPASGVDEEGLEVAKECLSEAFKIDLSSIGTVSTSESLVDMFSSRQQMGRVVGSRRDLPGPSSAGNSAAANATQSQVDGSSGPDHSFGTSKDELFGQYFGALEKIHYFSMPDGNDDQARMDRATHIFYKALEEMQRSGCETFDRRNLADTLKVQGNKTMQIKLYHDAIELYTFAIALCEDNAVYYCNRAAAYTQIACYQQAMRDCLKSIEIDPNYSKAYSRLGFVYYAQGRYRDAIDEGFIKALRLDPNNTSVKENIRAAEARLRAQQQRTGQNQGSTSTSQQSARSRSHSVPPQFNFQIPTIPVDLANMLRNMASSVPQGQNFQSGQEGASVDIGSMFRNMASNVSQGQSFQTGGPESVPTNMPNNPEIRIDGDVNLDFVDEMPADLSGALSGALRSVREMLSGGAPQGNPEEHNERERQSPS